MKKTYEDNPDDWDVYIESKQKKGWIKLFRPIIDNAITLKCQLIHKKHADIAKEVASNPDAEVEFADHMSNGYFVKEKNFFKNYDQNTEYRLKSQKEDFNGYYFPATTEVYNLLIENGNRDIGKQYHNTMYYGTGVNDGNIYYFIDIAMVKSVQLKQGYIINGKLSKVPETPNIDIIKPLYEATEQSKMGKYVEVIEKSYQKEHFAKFGFKVPDIEVELYAIKNNLIFGSFNDEKYGWRINTWKLNGESLDGSYSNLKPIKKPWYEDKSNFPCLIKVLCKPYGNPYYIAYSFKDGDIFDGFEREIANAESVEFIRKIDDSLICSEDVE
jgi:hypothetical protein